MVANSNTVCNSRDNLLYQFLELPSLQSMQSYLGNTKDTLTLYFVIFESLAIAIEEQFHGGVKRHHLTCYLGNELWNG